MVLVNRTTHTNLGLPLRFNSPFPSITFPSSPDAKGSKSEAPDPEGVAGPPEGGELEFVSDCFQPTSSELAHEVKEELSQLKAKRASGKNLFEQQSGVGSIPERRGTRPSRSRPGWWVLCPGLV